MNDYQILVNSQTYEKIGAYLDKLKSGESCGRYLHDRLQRLNLPELTVIEFIEVLTNTKRPQIFAEFEVNGNGTDWNQEELAILGDLSIVASVTVYDNGMHRNPTVHEIPFLATLIFTPGALLRNANQITPVDWEEVTHNGELSRSKYYRLYERRLLPAFICANDRAKHNGKMALITIPGMGCGQFAGVFKGQLGAEFKDTLITFLRTHGHKFLNIKVVYYDPYQECDNERLEIDKISFLVRPLTKGNINKPQLCQPQAYAEAGDDFTDCELFSFVAWDHVSWPGNDFYLGARSTDDGVKAAATNIMKVMTGIEGRYDCQTFKYHPLTDYETWKDVVIKNKIQLEVIDNLTILPPLN